MTSQQLFFQTLDQTITITNLLGINDDNSSSNKNIRIDNWRPDIGPRIINVDKDTSSGI